MLRGTVARAGGTTTLVIVPIQYRRAHNVPVIEPPDFREPFLPPAFPQSREFTRRTAVRPFRHYRHMIERQVRQHLDQVVQCMPPERDALFGYRRLPQGYLLYPTDRR